MKELNLNINLKRLILFVQSIEKAYISGSRLLWI